MQYSANDDLRIRNALCACGSFVEIQNGGLFVEQHERTVQLAHVFIPSGAYLAFLRLRYSCKVSKDIQNVVRQDDIQKSTFLHCLERFLSNTIALALPVVALLAIRFQNI